MFVQPYTYNNYNTRYTSFSSRGNAVKVQESLQKSLNKATKKSEPVQSIYDSGIAYLSKKIDKETYLKLLDSDLKRIYKQNSSSKNISERIILTAKEEEFFDDMFTTLDLYSKKEIPEEKLRRALQQLAKP